MDSQLDPRTGDYAGVDTDSLHNAIYIRLATPLGSWFANPALGSRLHELQRNKALPRIAVLAKQYAEQALQPILDGCRVSAISVTAQTPGDNGILLLQIAVTDAGGNVRRYNHHVSVQ